MQTGKVVIFEGGPPKVAALATGVIAAAQSLVEQIGPMGALALAAAAR